MPIIGPTTESNNSAEIDTAVTRYSDIDIAVLDEFYVW
jgi:hypothetical protein